MFQCVRTLLKRTEEPTEVSSLIANEKDHRNAPLHDMKNIIDKQYVQTQTPKSITYHAALIDETTIPSF